MPRTGAIRAGRAFVELFADDSKLVRGLKRAQLRLRKFGASVRAIGLRMLALSGAAAGPMVFGVREAARFEEQMGKVATMVDDAGRHMGRLRKAVARMAAEFGESSQTLSDGLYDILSAQIPLNRALDVLREGTKAAVGGFTDAKTSISALITLLYAYGDQLKSVSDASDFLFSVVKRGRLTYEDLSENLGKVAPIAAAAGVKLEDLGAALALVTRGMPNVERATIALANVIETFLKNTDDAQAVARRLGIEMSAAGLRSQGLLYVMRQLAKVDPDTVARIFPRRRALRGLVIAVQHVRDLGVDIDAMRNRAGQAEIAYRKLAHTPTREFRRFMAVVRGAARAIGEALLPALMPLLGNLKKVVGAVGDWVRANGKAIVLMARLVAGVGAAGVVLIGLGTALRFLAFGLGGLTGLLRVVHFGLGSLVTVFSALLSPVGLVTAAVVALGACILHATGAGGKALRWLGEKFAALKEDALKALGGIKDALAAGDIGLAARVLWLTLKMEWQKGIRPLRLVWEKLVFGFKAAFEIAVHRIEQAWLGLTYGLKRAWTEFSSWWKTTQTKLSGWFARRMLEVQGLFDETLDVEFAKRQVDISIRAEVVGLDREKAAKIGALKDEQRVAEQLAREDHERRLAQISDQYDARIAAAEEALAKARKEWQQAIEAAGRKGEAAAEGTSEAPLEGLADQLKAQLGGMGALLDRAISVRGTFAATAVWGLGTGNAMDRTARATEETAKNTRRMLEMNPAFT